MSKVVDAFLEHLHEPESVMLSRRTGTERGPLATFPICHHLGPPATKAHLARLRSIESLPPELVELWSKHDGMLLYCDAKFPPDRLYSLRERQADSEGLVNDSSFLRFERIADWNDRRKDAAWLNELGKLGFTKLDGVPFASTSHASEAFFWAPDGVHLFENHGRHKRVAKTFAAFLRWLVKAPVEVMESSAVSRFYRGDHQYYPVQFASARRQR